MNWVRVSKTRYDCEIGRVQYPRTLGVSAVPPGWYGHRWDALEYCAGPCATPDEAMRAVEAAVGEVA